MRTAICAIIAATIAAMTVSCAKPVEVDLSARELASLDAWIKLHAPEAVQLTEGIYYEILEPAPADALPIENLTWVSAEYDIKDINGNTVYTRSEGTAKRMGSYSKYTRYVPDFMFLGSKPASSSMPAAMFYALQEMSVGEVWRIYSVSEHIFDAIGINNEVGYGGQRSLAANSPAIIDSLTVLETVMNPDQRERDLISNLVIREWGFEDERDSLKSHLYLQRLNPGHNGAEVSVGSSAWLYYKAYFLEDGSFLDTNIDSVWNNRFGSKRYSLNQVGMQVPVEDTTAIAINRRDPMTVSTEMPLKVLGFVMEWDDLHYGDSLRMVVSSPYAYGDVGRIGHYKSNQSYNFNEGYYGAGGYAGDFGRYYYDGAISDFYKFYNTTSTSTLYPVPEVKFFTPLVYEIVVKEPNFL